MTGTDEDRLRERATDRVMERALGLGAFSGMAVGFLTPAFTFAFFDGGNSLPAGLVFGVIGAVAGAVIGVVCALVPAVVLGLWPDFFRRHPWYARLCAGSVAGALTIALTVHAVLTTDGYKTAIAFAITLGAATVLGAYYAPCALAEPTDAEPRRCVRTKRWLSRCCGVDCRA